VNPARQIAPEPARATSSPADQHRQSHERRGARRLARPALTRPALARYAGLPVVVAVSAVLNTHRLAHNGYANIFYSAGVTSMLRSLHNLLFVSFDPGGLVSVDKPPLALWVQALSAKLFGFSPLSLLLPEALIGVATVALLYVLLARRLGGAAAFAGSLALAVFPSFVAVSRDNGVDPLLILLMLAACGLALRACESGRWRTLVACGAVVGLAFNTKTLAAYLVVPSIALGYLLCAPGSPRRRLAQLLAAGAAMLVVSFAWIALVELTPASQRPYVGSSADNSELGLTFEYNGVGRVEGQAGGPGEVVVKTGAYVPAARQRAVDDAARAHHARPAPPVPGEAVPKPEPASAPVTVEGRERDPIPFGESPGPLRLFEKGLGDQAGWLLGLALFGLIALALLLALEPSAQRRRDPRLATLLVLGGWFLVEAAVLSLSKGIVHPYYVSALAPGAGAMAGAGAVALARLARGRHRVFGLALVACALASTGLVQVVLMHREHYMTSFAPVLAGGFALAFAALLALRRLAAPALALAFALALVVPSAYAATTWLAPVEGTFPVAGPKAFAGPGGYGVNAHDLAIDRALLRYVSTHRPGSRWALLTVASDSASPMMLMGLHAGALGGYSGTDQALDGPGLARLVANGQARYVMLGGEYSLRGGNRATVAVLHACRELAPSQWNSPIAYPYGLVLFDCAGRARALAGASADASADAAADADTSAG
jgi:4-amino-4-deoxy-L-arabinose transferase-like glycosyltransferase